MESIQHCMTLPKWLCHQILTIQINFCLQLFSFQLGLLRYKGAQFKVKDQNHRQWNEGLDVSLYFVDRTIDSGMRVWRKQVRSSVEGRMFEVGGAIKVSGAIKVVEGISL